MLYIPFPVALNSPHILLEYFHVLLQGLSAISQSQSPVPQYHILMHMPKKETRIKQSFSYLQHISEVWNSIVHISCPRRTLKTEVHMYLKKSNRCLQFQNQATDMANYSSSMLSSTQHLCNKHIVVQWFRRGKNGVTKYVKENTWKNKFMESRKK